jgi:DNA-binding response OmpR family regulator
VLERRPDLLLLDIKLPELDGFEVLRGVRLYLNDRETMVLVMTSVERSDVPSLELGADGFLPKPFEVDQLRAHVRSLLRRVAPGRSRR